VSDVSTSSVSPLHHAGSDKPLRIALFSGNYNNVVDGPVKALNRLVGYLLEQGHDVRVFAPEIPAPAITPTGTLVAVPSIAIPGRGEYRLARSIDAPIERVTNPPAEGLLCDGKPVGTARDILADFKPDLIHLSAPDRLGFSALKYANQNAIPAVASFHTRFDTYLQYYGAGFLQPVLLNLMRSFYGRCEHVYVPSMSMGDALRADRIGEDIRLWTRGVDGALFMPQKRDESWRAGHGLGPDHVAVLFVGRIVLEKGLEVFAKTVGAVREANPNLRALIIGDGPERARFESMLPDDSVFLGYQGGADLARGYANADIFLNPSITETFGNVTLEAMASGLPTVCARASGSVSLIEDKKTGLLGPPTAAGLTEPLRTLAENAQMRAAYGAAARQVADGFNWDEILGGLVENYRAAIAAFSRS